LVGTRKKVLLADSDPDHLSDMSRIFHDSGHHVSCVPDGILAYDEVLRDEYGLVIAELKLPRMNGLELLQKIKEVNDALPVFIVSSDAQVREAVEAMKMGATDFFLKPLSLDLVEIISRMSGSCRGRRHASSNGKYEIITRNKEMKRLLREAEEIADSRASVFIQGESGTGKELFARYIHNNSKRQNKPFVAINCAALPENLLESELFGHEKGAFTGALNKKKGKFELAHQGSILLDEISEMDLQLQRKLLRVLQEREIDRVGGTDPIPIDVRIIATTNRNIEKQMEEGGFREDLYYRLNVIPFQLPPLRERLDDIPLLAEYFVNRYNHLDHRNVKGLTDDALTDLMSMPWKGNVREFENVMERAVLRCKGDLIDREVIGMQENNSIPHNESPFMFTLPLKEMEKNVILRALDQTNGNRTHAAELLGISVRTLRNKLTEYRKKMEIQ
jgi:two-component system response regulator FlrC